MTKLTFAFDCQLNDNEDCIKEGTIVEVADIHHMKNDCTPVIIKNAYDYKGNPIEVNQIEFFMNYSFVELR